MILTSKGFALASLNTEFKHFVSKGREGEIDIDFKHFISKGREGEIDTDFKHFISKGRDIDIDFKPLCPCLSFASQPTKIVLFVA